MARDFNIQNIEFLQGDTLNLDNLREKYHIIECSGVLHHMQDPVKGWRSLLTLIEPGGLLKVALYSERARQTVTAARELIKENQLTTSNEHIRIFRQAILENLVDGDFSLIKQSNDFYNLSGCRDLLFHAKEYQFNPLSIHTVLQELNMNFLGFVNIASKVKKDFDGQYLEDKNRIDLANWVDFETKYPDAFSGMFQFYCQLKTGTISNFP